MKYVVLLSIVLFFGGLDALYIQIVVERGGWDAYVATNPFWQTAVAYFIMLNFLFVCSLVIWWICRND